MCNPCHTQLEPIYLDYFFVLKVDKVIGEGVSMQQNNNNNNNNSNHTFITIVNIKRCYSSQFLYNNEVYPPLTINYITFL